MSVTREEWRNRIRADLGGEGVDIELTETQCDDALARALELFNRHRPQLAWFPFEVNAAETTVISFFNEVEQKDEHLSPYGYVRNVLNVQFQDRSRRVPGARGGFLQGYYLRWGYEGPRVFYEIHTGMRLYEKLTGSRPDWYWDKNSRKLYIYNPTRDVNCMVLCSRERKLEEITYDMESLFLQAATARAKSILARILGSRGPFPGPAGNIVTDAKELRKEGKEEWEAVVKKLEVSLASYPPPQYIG